MPECSISQEIQAGEGYDIVSGGTWSVWGLGRFWRRGRVARGMHVCRFSGTPCRRTARELTGKFFRSIG